MVNTPTGTQVEARPVDSATGANPVSVTFSAVTQIGSTTLTINSTGPIPPDGFQLGSPANYYEISTTATYTAPVTICIGYAGINFGSSPQLFHFEGGVWRDVTTSVDTVTQIVCGAVSSFSPFALMERSDRKLVADAGPDRDVECTAPDGTPVTLDGSRSSRGPGLTYVWKGDFGKVEGMVAMVKLPLGTDQVKLEVSSGRAKAKESRDRAMNARRRSSRVCSSGTRLCQNGWNGSS